MKICIIGKGFLGALKPRARAGLLVFDDLALRPFFTSWLMVAI
jgi:hypothetical protein